MKIPASAVDRQEFALKWKDACFASRERRINQYSRLYSYYLYGKSGFGTGSGAEQAEFNKLSSHIETIASYLYAADGVRFSIHTSPGTTGQVRTVTLEQADALSRYLGEEFHDQACDLDIAMAVLWSLIYNTVILKPFYANGAGIGVGTIAPYDFGVGNEALSSLRGQQAMCHAYRSTREATEADLARWGLTETRIRAVMRSAGGARSGAGDQLPDAVRSIVMSGLSPNASGIVDVFGRGGTIDYRPDSGQDGDMVERFELWLFDDETGDWRIARMVEDTLVDMSDRNFYLPGRTPFVQLTPSPMLNYFWGQSELASLTRLQDWINHRVEELRRMQEKEDRPPRAYIGLSGISEEKAAAMDDPGAFFTDASPGGKVEKLFAGVPSDAYESIQFISSMFAEQSGMTPVLQGRGEPGVRGQKHAEALAQYAGSRLGVKALRVERALEETADRSLELLMRRDGQRISTHSGFVFSAAQFESADPKVRVDSHSASPLFRSRSEQLAFALAELHAIDGDSLIELTHPPHSELLRERFARMAAEERKLMAEGLLKKQAGKRR